MKLFKKTISLVLALTLVLSLFAGAVPSVFASLNYWPEPLEIPNEYHYKGTTLQPYGSCFLIDELKNWSPDNDPDARYNRSGIPLRERWMGPSVNPLASRDAGVMPLAMGNARASQGPSQGGDGAAAYVFTFFQYLDVYNFWGGSSGEGPIAIPSPELIDAGHRNGVPVTGTIFIPWGDSAYGNQFVQEMVEQDEQGHFIAADKLIEIAQYYGFDGYIFNAESGTGVPGFKEFLIYLQENKPDNFTISWYNGRGSISESDIDLWMQDGDTRITDHWWLDMSGGSWGGPGSSVEAALNSGVDPFKVHSSWENWPQKSNSKGGSYETRLDENGKVVSSLGILAPTASLMASTSPEDFMNVQDPEMWVGPSGDPSSERPATGFCGFASMIADRTPILGTEFVTNFTTGNGHNFYEDGVVVGKTGGWYNRSIGDVMPTWRWMIESEGQKLDAIIDYADAWYAGTSLKLSGSMDAGKSNHVKLYSTNLQITDASSFEFVYKTPVEGVNVELGLCFGDTYAPENFKFYPLTTDANGQWNTTSLDLSADAGKTAIAISLRLTAPDGVTDYSLNVGRMALTTDNYIPGAPSNAVIDETLFHTDTTMEARIYWDKADDAFMNRIYRIHTDGTRELVGVTPSDAFYLGQYDKEPGETALTFEIVSYSENGVKGGSTTLDIAWPEEVPDGFVPVFDQGENLALKKPAVSLVDGLGTTGVHQLNDGTVLNGSKWCAAPMQGAAVIDLGETKTLQRWVTYHANCEGAGEGVSFNTVAFDLLYAEDDGAPLMDGDTQDSRNRANALQWKMADSVTDNKQDVTDRNLSAPINARYIKLQVNISDACPWHAIRVYELELFEKPGIDNTASPTEKNVTVINNAGAADEVIIDRVRMPFASGSLSDHNGVIAEDTGKVRLFADLTSEEPIAVVKASQPNELYKQLGIGVSAFENLELKPEGGRLYYDVLQAKGDVTTHSRRASVAYAPETGAAPAAPSSVKLERTTGGQQLRSQYGRFTAQGLDEGAVVWIYENASDKVAVCRTMPAVNGEATVDGIPLRKEGGSIFYEIHANGKTVPGKVEITYDDPMNLPADLEGMNQLIEKCSAISQQDCTSATWMPFSMALDRAKAIAASNPSAAAAEPARAELAKAYANLRFIGNSQRLNELCELYASYKAEDYLASGYQALQNAVAASRALMEAGDCDNFAIEQSTIALRQAAAALEPYVPTAVTGVTLEPHTAQVRQGTTQQFTATVAGTGDFTQDVTWTLIGNQSEGTTLVDGLLTVDAAETAVELTVQAASVTDPTVSKSAVVTVIDKDAPIEKYVSYHAWILGNSGMPTNSRELPDYAFDNDEKTKWCCTDMPNYIAFAVNDPTQASRIEIIHAGAEEGAVYNTVDFTFDVLDQSKHTDAEVLAMTYEEQKAIFDDASNWIVLQEYKNNSKNVTDDPIVTDQVSRIYRMNVLKGAGDTMWSDASRVYEIRLYGFDAKYPEPAEEVKVTIDPPEMTVVGTPGQKGQFSATVTGAEDTSVVWTITGNTSEETRIENGQLFLGVGETAKTLTVTATSVADPSKSASATVTVEAPTFAIHVASGMAHGTVIPSKTEAAQGEIITLEVKPDSGYTLVDGSLKVNGAAVEGLSFEMPAQEVVITAEFTTNVQALAEAAQAAQQAAERAQAAAEEAQLKAEAAQAAAEEASKSTAADKTAAEAAQAKAEEAKAQADSAQAAAESAQAAAEEAAQAAEESNLAAAKAAAKAAEAVAQTAENALNAAESARQAAASQEAAQAAQAAAEEAQAVAEQAKRDAAKAKEAAEEAANSSASDKEAAENAKKEAAAAEEAAEEAQASAENAAAAAEAAKVAAAASNEAAAQAAQEAAESAANAAKAFQEITEMKSQMVEYLHDTQKAREEAEAARKAAEAAELACAKYFALYSLSNYVDMDDYRVTEQKLVSAAIDDAVAAINAAKTPAEADQALADAKLAIDQIPTAEEQKLPFADVKEGDWFENAVRYVYRNDLFKGVSKTSFAPRAVMTRGQLITVLYRLAGEPKVEGELPFADVKADAYYAKAVLWGVRNGIAQGVVADRFDPNAPVTRGQAAAFLYRYAKAEPVKEDHLEDFADVKTVPAYAVEALNWAVANEILTGAQSGEDLVLAAHRQINRAEVASILMRFCEAAEQK